MVVITTTPSSFGRDTLKVCRRGRQGNILLVAFSRLSTRNAFNDDVYEDLIDVMSLATDDKTVSAIVLTGTGSYFSSGADLKSNAFDPQVGGRKTLQKPAGRFMMSLIRFPKVLAAAVQGPAVGIAVTLLMHCDLVFCSSTATLWVPFTRLALVPELCSSVTLVEAMGLSKANELLLLGRKIDAETALAWNICSRVVPVDETPGRALADLLIHELDDRLYSLPLGNVTSEYFCSLVKGQRRLRMEQVCLKELDKLDERFDSGQVKQAVSQLTIGNKAASAAKHGSRSRL